MHQAITWTNAELTLTFLWLSMISNIFLLIWHLFFTKRLTRSRNSNIAIAHVVVHFKQKAPYTFAPTHVQSASTRDITLTIIHQNPNFLKILLWSHPNFDGVIVTKFCCAIVAYVKFWSNLMTINTITATWNFCLIWNMSIKSLVKWSPEVPFNSGR